MAVFSALKNKKNQKMREGLEDLVTKCSEATEKDEVNVQVSKIYHAVNRLRSFLSSSHLVIRSLSHLVTW